MHLNKLVTHRYQQSRSYSVRLSDLYICTGQFLHSVKQQICTARSPNVLISHSFSRSTIPDSMSLFYPYLSIDFL